MSEILQNIGLKKKSLKMQITHLIRKPYFNISPNMGRNTNSYEMSNTYTLISSE